MPGYLPQCPVIIQGLTPFFKSIGIPKNVYYSLELYLLTQERRKEEGKRKKKGDIWEKKRGHPE